jgi:hypothetical protein
MKTEEEEVIFQAQVQFNVLEKIFPQKFKAADTTPSVLNLRKFLANNVGAVTVTQFDDGAEAQEISILGEGFTTVANNANIKTNTGANKLLAANKIYRFTRINGVWYEDA